MSEARSVTLADDLYEQVEREARAGGKTIDEVIKDALGEYLGLRGLDRLHGYGRQQAAELGLTEADVPKLIAESRRDSRQ